MIFIVYIIRVNINTASLAFRNNLITLSIYKMQSGLCIEEIQPQQAGTVVPPMNQPIISYDWVLEPSGPNKVHGLALSNYEFAKNIDLLKENNISAVVSVFG